MNPWQSQISALASNAADMVRIHAIANKGQQVAAMASLEHERTIYAMLRTGPLRVDQLSQRSGLSLSCIRHHLQSLSEKGKVRPVGIRPRQWERVENA